jgi:hypothetical protein
VASNNWNYVCTDRLLPPPNLIMSVLSAKNLLFSSLATPQGKGIMASSQGLTFLSGIATFVALSFYSPPQNPAVDSYVHCSDSNSDFEFGAL